MNTLQELRSLKMGLLAFDMLFAWWASCYDAAAAAGDDDDDDDRMRSSSPLSDAYTK